MDDDVAIALLTTLMGAVRVALAVVGHERWGAGPTVGAAFVVLGSLTALRLVRRRGLPRATLRARCPLPAPPAPAGSAPTAPRRPR